MFSQKAITSTAVIVLMIISSSKIVLAQSIGSQSQIWLQKSSVEKTAYLEGFCHGLSVFGGTPTYNKMGEQICTRDSKSKSVFRFCGKVWDDDAKPAIQYLDIFYRDKNHSDVPMWAIVADHNDQTCNENTVKGRLPSIQASALCSRQLLNMHGTGVSKPVIDKQREECDKLMQQFKAAP